MKWRVGGCLSIVRRQTNLPHAYACQRTPANKFPTKSSFLNSSRVLFLLSNPPPANFSNMEPSYREFVRAQVYRNPCLQGLSSFFSNPYIPASSVPVHCLDFFPSHGTKTIQRTMRLEACLSDITHVLNTPPRTCIRRIMCIEDIDPYSIEKLGMLLDINPLFFATYIGTSFIGVNKAPSPPLIALFPSSFASTDSLHLHYQRVIKLPTSKGSQSGPYEFKSAGNIPRSVRCLMPFPGTQPGLVRGCCSILLKILNDQSWICTSVIKFPI